MKKIQKFVQSVLILLALGAAAYSTSLRAEDIDIYLDNSGGATLPNLLFVIDNSSNLASNWSSTNGCKGYANGTSAETPSMGTNTAGGIVQCALVDAINSIPNGVLKFGIMAGNANGFGTSRGCMGSNGGCLLYPLTEINATTRTDMVTFIKSWVQQNTNNDPTKTPFTVTSAASGGMMQESWAYYNGKTGLSGRTYNTGSLLQACQKNFIIYIGNTDKTPANEDLSGPTALTAAGATTPAQTGKITTTQLFNPAICGTQNIQSFPAGSNANDWSSNWADEWSRLLFQQDGGTATMEGMQNVTTYTIGIIDNSSNQCTAAYPALLQSMATVGGGKAFRVSNASEVTQALAAALNEVQAVNSVFSSASLPVSVNAEGSYLNQIFLGMFRPDSTGAPRWLGNLKQYQLIRNSAGQLVMGDACTGPGCPKPAITSGGTGFLAPNAVSFWTYRDDTSLPDSVGGFFVNNKLGTPPSGYDLADGEVVEKGGVAQLLRKQNLTATFAGAGGTAVNPRRVFTYCPDGTTCVNDLTTPDNDFSTANTKIAAASFGSALTIPVQSITRSGKTATITTTGNHGFTAGSIVTIRNANQPEYNQTQAVTVLNATQFTMTVPDYPTTPSQGTYTISVPGGSGTFAITAMSRTVSNAGSASETMTVTTNGPHPYVVPQTVNISGVTPTEFNGYWTLTATPATNQFTFSMPIHPVSPAVNSYQVVASPRVVAVNTITVSGTTYTVATASAHGFHPGQTVTVSGVKGNYAKDYNANQTVTSVAADGMSFTIQPPATLPGNAGTGSVTPSTQANTAAQVTRLTTAVTGPAMVTGMPVKWFANGDKVNITTAGTSPNEGAYVASDATITCSVADCSSFTYPITVTPAVQASAFGAVSIPGAGATANVVAGAITRSGQIATVTGVTPALFKNGTVVNISPSSGAGLSTESAYVGNWTINCGTDPNCGSFTFGPVTMTPASPATGTNMQAYSGNTAPDKDLLIKWLRGQDNQGDEKGPGNGVTVRPSAHGDVLHSRPLVINYGDSRGIVVFYGSNDGVYRAINGNETSSITNGTITVPAGGELWGLILPEHYQLINRYRANAPELRFPGTWLATALPKDYFVDGPTGVYEKLRADGSVERAIIYLTMRRGGRVIYALDVTQPMTPQRLWSVSQQTPGFEELGQTWSRPRLTLLQNYTAVDPATGKTFHKPVLVFGAGYDPAEDAEAPTGDTMGRGIFVVDALDGSKVFSASVSCPLISSTCRNVPGMKYATPADISFVDRDLDGFIDKFYWGDLGGNLWRADVADASVANWSVTRVAQLGCNTGECPAGTAPRKFFFPPAVLSVRPSGAADSYDALSIASGDREHPLRNESNPNSAFNVSDRFFMVKDLGTLVNNTSLNTRDVTASDIDLFNATYTLWDGTHKGFYINFIGAAWSSTTNQPDPTKTPTKGEKAVNAPVAVNGQIFFATNQPKDKVNNTCVANLGTARAYAVSPFTGGQAQNELAGGGLPPSAVSGVILVTTTSGGTTTTTQEKFCIGCGLSGSQSGGSNTAPCTSALEQCNAGTVIPKNLKRTYWYKK